MTIMAERLVPVYGLPLVGKFSMLSVLAKQMNARPFVVGYPPDSVFSKQASEKETLEALKRAARTVLGKEPHVVIELDSERARAFDTVAAREVRAREQRVRKAMHAAKNHPSVLGAVEILGARIKDVKLANE